MYLSCKSKIISLKMKLFKHRYQRCLIKPDVLPVFMTVLFFGHLRVIFQSVELSPLNCVA